MSDLLAITYPDQHRGAEVFAILQRMEAERLVDLEDAVYATKDFKGKVRLHQAINLTSTHTASGDVWGTLIGLLFAAPVIGPAVSNPGGAIGKPSDYGINDQFVRHLGINTPPGSSVIFVLVRSVTPAEIMRQINRYGGTILHSPLAPDAEQRLRAADAAPQS